MLVLRVSRGDTMCNRIFEHSKIRVIFGVQAFLSNKAPQSFHQIQMWRVCREVQQFNTESLGISLYKLASLITRIVQDNRYWQLVPNFGDFFQEPTNAFRVNVGFIGYRDDFFGDSIDCPQHIETFSS